MAGCLIGTIGQRNAAVGTADHGKAQRWPGGYEQWLEDRTTSGTRGSVASSTVPGKRPKAAERPSTGRSHSTVRHELKAAEKDMTRLEKARERLDRELVEAGTDHVQLASVGEAIAVNDAAVAACEERWLELSEELENR